MNNKPKNTNNILIIVSIIFVTVAVIAFVIALSLFSGGEVTPQPVESSSFIDSSSSAESSSSLQSSSTPREESSSDSESSSDTESSSDSGIEELTLAERIVENARRLLDTPFLDGGEDEGGFDSSGFIYYVMRESGFVSCPRNIVQQSKMGVMREFDEIEEGDILFFSNEEGGKPDFAGFYAGNGKMIGSLITSSFEGVVEVNINGDYYRRHYVTGVGIS